MKISIKIFYLCLFFLFEVTIYGQKNYSFEHYQVEDGLPHNIVNKIIQDKKGFIWIATTNGLSRYTGYSFTNFKPKASDSIIMKNTRIDDISEDIYGRIWMTSKIVTARAYCFDPKTESFWGTDLIPELSNTTFNIRKIEVNKSGKVWLISENNKGCILVADSKFKTEIFNNLSSNTVNTVFEDSKKRSWILTNNGINLVNHNNSNETTNYFIKKTIPVEFHSAIEIGDEIWFGGSKGIFLIYSKENHNFLTKKTQLNSNIIKLEKINNHTILAITDQDGFCTINIFTGAIKVYNSKTLPKLNTKNLNPVSFINKHQFWFVTNNQEGINLFDFKDNSFTYFPGASPETNLGNNPVIAYVLKDIKGSIWVQPSGGIFSKFDSTNKKLIPFNPPYNPFDNSNYPNNLHTAFFDKQGNLWYNTFAFGLFKITFNDSKFKTSSLKPSPRNVRAIYQDKKQNIWISNRQKEIIIYDKLMNVIGEISPSGKLEKSAVWPKTAYSIIEDKNSAIWIGTKGDGLYKLTPQDKEFHFKVEHFLFNNNDIHSLSSNDIYSVYEDNNGLIWVGSFNGLNLIKQDKFGKTIFINNKNKWKTYPSDLFNQVRCINQDRNGNILVGSTDGLLVLKSNINRFKNLGIFKTYEIKNVDSNGLMSNDIIDICVTKKGQTILATADGGISKIISKDNQGFPLQFKTFGRNEGLPSNNLLSLIEDNNGKIWAATDDILTRFDPDKEYFEIFPELKWIIANKNFSEATKVRLKSGELCFGYSNGIVHFFPNQIKTNNYTPYLAFTNLRLFNKKVDINVKDSPLKSSLDNSKKIVLKHNQNFFNIEFAALDYRNSKNIKYAYKLEGFDKKWNFVNNVRTAVYTNVPKGEYTFKVKSTNSQGNWVDNERQLQIILKPAFWNTTIAYFIYILLTIGIIVLVNHIIITIYRLKTDAKIEKEMFDMKQKFFIDISHELRTPLTLISSPIEYLINDNRTPEIIKKQLSYVSQSTNRLQRLVNQILDFRKIQDQKLKITEINLTEFISDIFNNFIEIAQERKINYNLEIEGQDIKLWADKNALEKILMNLLSNAFKYTPDEKSISVSILKNDKTIDITFKDEGIGISEEHQSSIFDRFSSFNKNINNPSTGIGLSIVKELVEKHQGEVSFVSKPNIGSTFSIIFKMGKNHFSDDVEFIEENTQENLEDQLIKTHPITLNNSLDNDHKKIKILVIEDDSKLRTFIKNVLEDDYEILEAEDGSMGYQKILETTPDFIISDIMMPKLNGVDLLKKIRNNIEISHVPVILLTAKTTIESQLEGLSYGADDYITKPFSVSYLKVRIVNLLEQRKRLQGIFDSYEKPRPKEYNPQPYLITDQDELIMQKVMQAIEENIGNNNFSVEDLGNIVRLNRTSFYYKIKSLTGYTPVEFIRDIRIKRVAHLLTNSQLLIKEIAYMTGFVDMKYFNKSFKNKYDVTPSEYRKENK